MKDINESSFAASNGYYITKYHKTLQKLVFFYKS